MKCSFLGSDQIIVPIISGPICISDVNLYNLFLGEEIKGIEQMFVYNRCYCKFRYNSL